MLIRTAKRAISLRESVQHIERARFFAGVSSILNLFPLAVRVRPHLFRSRQIEYWAMLGQLKFLLERFCAAWLFQCCFEEPQLRVRLSVGQSSPKAAAFLYSCAAGFSILEDRPVPECQSGRSR